MQLYQVNDLDSFLQVFLPGGGLLGGTHQHWIFRGQGNAKWGLVPSLFRRHEYRNIASMSDVVDRSTDLYLHPSEASSAADFELAIDQRLFAVLDDQGAGVARVEELAARQQSVSHHALTAGKISDERLALAQHLGLPTRLLDWCHSPWVAAYFAAASAAQRSGEGEFAVFAMHSMYFKNSQRLGKNRYIAPSSYGNTAMVAQGGVFMRVDQPTADVDGSMSWDLCHGHPRKNWTMGGRGSAEVDDRLVKVTAPIAIAMSVLRTLRTWGTYGATMYPGDRGVEHAVRELLLEG